jgi:CRISPR-associated endonuclease Csn1
MQSKKILGLDLGVASIGWAFIEENEKNQNAIIDMGVRIVPLNSDELGEFTKGNAISKNANRRIKRGMRRNVYRRTMRKDLLKKAIQKEGWLINIEHFKSIDKMGLWELRSKAVTEQVSLEELSRILYHINQKRGFKSNRKTDLVEDKKESDYKAEIRKNEEFINLNQVTIGQFFFQKLQENRQFKTKNIIFPRNCYINECELIWNKQQEFYPEQLTEDLKKKIIYGIIFHQRPLKSQKNLVNRCEFAKEFIDVNGKKMDVSPRVAPRTSPLIQLSKIWESVNNIRIKKNYWDKDGFALTLEQKNIIIKELKKKISKSEKDILKLLNLNDCGYKTNIADKGIQGDTTFVAIEKAGVSKEILQKIEEFSVTFSERIDRETGEIRQEVNASYEQSFYYKLWHTIYSIDQEDALKIALINNLGLDEISAEKLLKIDFTKAGFSNKSAKATRHILPYLMLGLGYSDAMNAAGYRHSDWLDKQENQNRDLLELLPAIPKNSLRQPVVEKILNQLVNLVNAIILDPNLGRPDEIRIEMARSLQQSMEERRKETKRIKDNEANNERIINELKTNYQIRVVTRSMIEKFKIYEETDGFSPYTGAKLSLADFLRGEGVEVEHIIPRSKLFDDSRTNKTIAETWVNKAKGNMTAADFIKKQPVPGLLSYEAYESFISKMVTRDEKSKRISKTKAQRFLLSESEIPQNFIDRQLRETQYITKKSLQLLQLITRSVTATSGGVTDFLRDQWGWNDVLQKINWERYEKMGLTEIKELNNGERKYIIQDWSKRDDHRHHAIDALVVASTKKSFIQSLNTLSQSVETDYSSSRTELIKAKGDPRIIRIGAQKPFTTEQVIEKVARILVSIKPGKRIAVKSTNKSTKFKQLIPRGPLSEESVYGSIKIQQKREVPINKNFDPNWLIVDKQIRKLVTKRLVEHDNLAEKAFKKPLYWDASETIPIKKVEIWEWVEEKVIKYPITTLGKKDLKFIIDPKVKEIMESFFDSFPNEKEAQKALGTLTIWYDEKHQIPIKSIRLKTGLTKVEPLKIDELGKALGYVKPGNNHHLAIYQNPDGTYFDKMFSLKDMFDLAQNGTSIADLAVLEGATRIYKFEQNNLFWITDSDGSDRLYRVQKISKNGAGQISVFFRELTETKLNDSKSAQELAIFYNIGSINALRILNPRAVSVSILGKPSNL